MTQGSAFFVMISPRADYTSFVHETQLGGALLLYFCSRMARAALKPYCRSTCVLAAVVTWELIRGVCFWSLMHASFLLHWCCA